MKGPQLAHFARLDPWSNTCFEGVYPLDRLPVVVSRSPGAVIVNTDPGDEAGEHWVSVYISSAGVGVYFDSFGVPPTEPELINFLNRNTVCWYHNQTTIQSVASDSCGYYCLYFVYKSARGYSLPALLRPFHPLRPHRNESRVTNWYYSHKRKLERGRVRYGTSNALHTQF